MKLAGVLLATWAAGSAIGGLVYGARARRSPLAVVHLRLTLLQAQVEPHFLFNTLASVRSLVTSDPQRASQTIDALAEHLRATLPKMRTPMYASSERWT